MLNSGLAEKNGDCISDGRIDFDVKDNIRHNSTLAVEISNLAIRGWVRGWGKLAFGWDFYFC